MKPTIKYFLTLFIAQAAISTGIIADEPKIDSELIDLPSYEVIAYRQGSLFERSNTIRDDLLAGIPLKEGRAVAFWDEWEMDLVAMDSIESLITKVPGGYAPARFGVATVPNVRGDAAETFFNGQRLGDNLFGIQPVFFFYDGVEILLGPGTVAEGPGKRTGGIMNLLGKRADIRSSFGKIETEVGTFVPDGGSFGSYTLHVDHNIPLSPKLALRFNIHLKEDDTYYRNNGGESDTVSLYANLHYEISSITQWDFFAVYVWQSQPQTLGVNRIWQGLIDGDQYFTGALDSEIGKSEEPVFWDPGLADPGLLVGGPGDITSIDRDRVLMSQGDYGKAKSYLFQSLLSHELGGNGRLQHKTLVEYVDRSKLNQFYYAEAVEQLTIDTQLVYESSFGSDRSPILLKTGIHARLEDRKNLTNYWNEFAYAFDLTKGRVFNAYDEFPENIAFGATEFNGDFWYLPGDIFSTPESTDSQLFQAGFFTRLSIPLSENISFKAGVRLDHYDLEARERLIPIGRERLEDSQDQGMISAHVTLERSFETSMLYFTAGHFGSVAGNTVGDGLNLHNTGMLHEEDFENETNLIEAGVKWAASTSLNLTIAAYRQERTRSEFFGTNNILVEGIEFQVDWTASERFGMSFTGAWMDAAYRDSAPAEFGGGSIHNVYGSGEGPTGEGNGFGYIRGFFLNSVAPGDHEIPGLSDMNLQLGSWYKPLDFITFGLWGSWGSEQNGNLAAEYIIPSQYLLNASLIIEWKQWQFAIYGFNITDERNWRHNGDTFFDQMLISRESPARYRLSVAYKY